MKKYLALSIHLLFVSICFSQNVNTVWPTQTQNLNVGIGTASAQDKLQVVGNLKINAPGAGSLDIAYTKISWNRPIGSGATVFDNHRDLGNVGFIFNTTTGAVGSPIVELMRLNANGSIGVGTPTPLANFHIENANSSIIRLSTNNLPNGAANYYTEIINNYNYAEAFAIKHNNTYILKAGGNGYEYIDLGNSNNKTINFPTSATGKVNIPAGRLVIGAVPDATLSDFKVAVNGNVLCRKVKVTQLGWADYVFDSSYVLNPLEHVESYISLNKHLPDIPSAATVETEGVDLGDSQATLLRKIEELTLYLIGMNKTIKQQATTIEQQAKLLKQEQQRIDALERSKINSIN